MVEDGTARHSREQGQILLSAHLALLHNWSSDVISI
jgi:hypothetical protein